VLGLDGFLTRQAARLVVLAGVEHPLARAQQVLRAFCGWDVGAELIRRTTHAHARRAGAGRARRGDAVRFAAAPGAVELLIDAGKVNTLDGWRDVKVGVLGKREPGSPATPDRSSGNCRRWVREPCARRSRGARRSGRGCARSRIVWG
jgi:hypothetical protein